MTASEVAVGVVGAGTMGAGIVQVALSAGHSAVMLDVREAALATGRERIERGLRRAEEKGRLTPGGAQTALGRLTTTTRFADFARCGLVVEAAPEDLSLKRRVIAQIDEAVAPEAIVATNTSTLSVAAIFGASAEPDRGLGLHFFNPAPVMRLVEVIRHAGTADSVVERSTAILRAWGKEPVLALDRPGFIVNRVARPYYGEALRLVGDGAADVATVDRLLKDAGFPMGPFELMDLIGIDVNLAAAKSVFEGFFGEPRFRPHPIQQAMVDGGLLGRKTGRGYYSYDARPDDVSGQGR